MTRETGKGAASKASRVLSDPNSSAAAKSAAASALTQVRAEKEATSARAASRASEVMRDPNASAAEKSAAASTLSQRADK